MGYLADKFEIKEKITAALDASYAWKVAQAQSIKRAAEKKAVDVTSRYFRLPCGCCERQVSEHFKKRVTPP